MNELHVISLGAGVQSSTMALMAAKGEITPMPKYAIFADTQAEPASVYRWLDWLEKQLPFPVCRVSSGSLVEQSKIVRVSVSGKKYLRGGIPFFVVGRDGRSAPVTRQCTTDFKIRPIRKELNRIREGRRVIQWIGISLDEVRRMKPSRDAWCENVWPLIENRMTRNDCLNWMRESGYPVPPRSACVFCPYHSDNEWRNLRDNEPESFSQAVAFERDIQNAAATALSNKSQAFYLHRSLVTIDRVDLSTDTQRGQILLWDNECEGMCGV